MCLFFFVLLTSVGFWIEEPLPIGLCVESVCRGVGDCDGIASKR